MKVTLKPGEISRLLDEKGLRKPYRSLAEDLDCTYSIIGNYLNETVINPSLEMMIKWSVYLGVDVYDLIIIEDDAEDSDEVEDRQRPPTLSRGREANCHQLSFPT